jgi:hypothetical protein
MTRRDQCYFVGRRASFLAQAQAAMWAALAHRVEAMAEMDIPKFRDLINAIRSATIMAGRKPAK